MSDKEYASQLASAIILALVHYKDNPLDEMDGVLQERPDGSCRIKMKALGSKKKEKPTVRYVVTVRAKVVHSQKKQKLAEKQQEDAGAAQR